MAARQCKSIGTLSRSTHSFAAAPARHSCAPCRIAFLLIVGLVLLWGGIGNATPASHTRHDGSSSVFYDAPQRSSDKHADRAPLSPLLAYLYSHAASADAVALTAETMPVMAATFKETGADNSLKDEVQHSDVDALSMTEKRRISAATLQLSERRESKEDVQRKCASPAHANAGVDNAHCAACTTSSSSSADSRTAPPVASLAASLTGRYVVLSRSVVVPSSRQSAPMPNTQATLVSQEKKKSAGATNSTDHSFATPLSASTSPMLQDSAVDARRTTSRVYPEEALRLLTEAMELNTASSWPSAAASPRVSQQRHTASPLSATASVTSLKLEVHVIDATHILVYLPPSAEAAALLRAMASDNNDGAMWRVWDAFGRTEGGPGLKLSETLRGLLSSTSEDTLTTEFDPSLSQTSASSFASFSIPAGSATVETTYEVTLWTASGAAGAVYDALTKTARLQRYMKNRGATSSLTGAAPSVCYLTLEAPAKGADAVWVRVKVKTPYDGMESSSWQSEPLSSINASSAQGQASLGSQGRQGCLGDVLLTLASHPAVRWVEESYRRPELLNSVVTRTIQHGSCSTYAVDDMESGHHTPMWDLRFNGSGEVIAIADSGVDTESCYFRDPAESIAFYPDINPRHRKIVSYLAYVDEQGVTDATDKPGGHGTHVAGTAGGCVLLHEGEAATRTSLYNGVATGAKLFVRDMDDPQKAGLYLPSNLREIFDKAYDVGARICSNSWGFKTSSGTYLAIEKMFDTAVASRRNFLVLSAVSNAGFNNVYVPSRAKNVLAVGSHLNSPLSEVQNVVPERSGYGVTYDRRRKPDLVAPGGGGGSKTNVTSARAAATQTCATTAMHGTSMATAAAAGAAAVVRQYLREQWNFADPSSALLRAALFHATTAAMAVEPLRRGFGRLDLSLLLPHQNRSVDPQLPQLEHWFKDDAVVYDEEVREYCFTLADLPVAIENTTSHGTANAEGGGGCSRAASLTVKATLVWNDPGTAVEGSAYSQVHDLDLMLVTSNGDTFFSGADGHTRDRFSTAEQIRVALTLERNATNARTSFTEWRRGFRVLVRGAEVRSAAGQDFALVVTGPGLEAVPTCAAMFEQWRATPAAATVTGNEKGKALEKPVSTAFCPMNCTGHGTCEATSLLCRCDPGYTSVDCAECSADVHCHGHGTCDTQTMTCACDPGGHFADSHCTTCAKGWYGPDCASNCTCLHGGVCDESTGQCSCVRDTTLRPEGKGCFQGPQCQYCCDDFGGAACNQRSYWCDTTGAVVTVDNPDGGFIQINGFGAYGYSLTCRWAIRAQPGQQIHLQFLSFQTEQMDRLSVYDFVPNAAASTVKGDGTVTLAPMRRKRVERLSGVMNRSAQVITSTAEQMDLEFEADWEGADQGFVLLYRFTSCSERCRLTNLTGPVGHWRCGDAFGLPPQQCICEPPYVGWNCNEDASDISQLSRELNVLQISSKRAWHNGELAWMLPRSVLTAAEVRLPVTLDASDKDAAPSSEAWLTWRSPNTTVHSASFPVTGVARLPLIVHGFSEVQLPLLTLPTPALLPSFATDTANVTGGSHQVVKVHLKLMVQLQVDAAWLDNDAAALGLSLGVSAASELASESPPSAVRYDDTAAPLSLNAFTFTPMALQKLIDCADVPMVELTVPLNLLSNVSSSAAPKPTTAVANVAAAQTEAEESHWTTRVVFTLLWKNAAGLKVPNGSVIDAAVFAREVVLSRSAPLAAMTVGELPAAGSTVRGKPVEMTCHAVARVPVSTGQQVVESTGAKAALAKKVSPTVRFVVVFFALCVGVIGGALWALWWAPDGHRGTYASVQTTDEGQDMQVVGKRN